MFVSPAVQTVGDHPNLSALDSISRLRSRSAAASRALHYSPLSSTGLLPSQTTLLPTSAPRTGSATGSATGSVVDVVRDIKPSRDGVVS